MNTAIAAPQTAEPDVLTRFGAIEITDRFSLVEVPSDSVDEVVSALRATRVKGQKVQVRPDRDARSSRPPAKSSGKGAPRPRGGR